MGEGDGEYGEGVVGDLEVGGREGEYGVGVVGDLKMGGGGGGEIW